MCSEPCGPDLTSASSVEGATLVDESDALKALLKRPPDLADPDEASSTQIEPQSKRPKTLKEQLALMTEEELKAEAERWLSRHEGIDSRAAEALRAQSAYELRVILGFPDLVDEHCGKELMGRIRVAVEMGHMERVRLDRARAEGTEPERIEVLPETEDFIRDNELDPVFAEYLRRCEKFVQKEVVIQGSLKGCRNPAGVCFSRIREARQSHLESLPAGARPKPNTLVGFVATGPQVGQQALLQQQQAMMRQMISNPMMAMMAAASMGMMPGCAGDMGCNMGCSGMTGRMGCAMGCGLGGNLNCCGFANPGYGCGGHCMGGCIGGCGCNCCGSSSSTGCTGCNKGFGNTGPMGRGVWPDRS